MRNKLSFIRSVIYKFKRSYGLPISYNRIATHIVDLETGETETTHTTFEIKRAVVLRARAFRSFVYDLAYISANKDFTTGGFFDPEDRKIILDAKDLPNNFIPIVDDFCIFQNAKYEVKEVFHFEDDTAYIVLVRKIRGAPIDRTEQLLSVMDLQQTVSYEKFDRLTRQVESVLELTQTLVETP